jgi:catechol 2,3-dioxygenase-like lactoylglutathione lyase family enzyme
MLDLIKDIRHDVSSRWVKYRHSCSVSAKANVPWPRIATIFASFSASAICVKEAGIPYGSGPFSGEDMQINTRRGGRGVYFKDPNGHLLELMTRT